MDCYLVTGQTSSSSHGSSSFMAMNNNAKTTRSNDNSKVKKSKSSSSSKKCKGVMKLSTDPQSVAARERRHRISDKFKILQSLIPGGSKLDTASMLEEAINYVKFLKTQMWLHQNMINFVDNDNTLYLQAANADSTQESANLYNSSADVTDVPVPPALPTPVPETWFHVQSAETMPFGVMSNYYY